MMSQERGKFVIQRMLVLGAILGSMWQNSQAFVVISQEEVDLYIPHVKALCANEGQIRLDQRICDLIFLNGENRIELGQNTHQKITIDALSSLSWKLGTNGQSVSFSKEALHIIAEANKEVDDVQTKDRHFDGEAFHAANARLKTYRAKVINELTGFDADQLSNSANVVSRGGQALEHFGQLLHTLQDFYAHSNWVEQQVEKGQVSNPNVLLILGLPGSDFSKHENKVNCSEQSLGLIDLTSGDYLGKFPETFLPSPHGTACDSRVNKCAHGPNWISSSNDSSCGMNKDAAGRTNNDMAVLLAKNHTALFADHVVGEVREYYGEDKFVADAAVCAFLGVAYTDDSCQKQLTIRKYREDTDELIAGGKVEVLSGTIDCGEKCAGPLLTGSKVELKASPKDGFTFVKWSDESEVCRGEETNPCIFTMNADKIAKAVFDSAKVGDIIFADPNLESCVLASYDASTPISSVNSLYCDNKGIMNLDGLEQLYALTSLSLIGNQISDIFELASITQLSWLRLSNNQITDLSELSTLTQLSYLDLTSNGIINLSGLGTLTQLKLLNLVGNEISNLSELSTLTQLTTLSLNHNQITDLSGLSTLTQLTSLNLYFNKIANLSGLSTLTQLTWLNLGLNQITSLSGLSTLTQLTDLHLSNNQISSVSELSTLSQLTTLYLDSNQVANVSDLSTLTQLNQLGLQSNRLTDVTQLASLTQLTSLGLASNDISSISALTTLDNLTWFSVNGNNYLIPCSELSLFSWVDTYYYDQYYDVNGDSRIDLPPDGNDQECGPY